MRGLLGITLCWAWLGQQTSGPACALNHGIRQNQNRKVVQYQLLFEAEDTPQLFVSLGMPFWLFSMVVQHGCSVQQGVGVRRCPGVCCRA